MVELEPLVELVKQVARKPWSRGHRTQRRARTTPSSGQRQLTHRRQLRGASTVAAHGASVASCADFQHEHGGDRSGPH